MSSSASDILLIDDNLGDARLFQAVCDDNRLRVNLYWVATGDEGLQALRQVDRFADFGPVKLVILDLHLPGMDGFSILREIRSDPALSRTPVLVMSTSEAQDDIDLTYSLGANGYFRKPRTLDSMSELTTLICRYWLDHAQLPTPVRAGKRSEPSKSSIRSAGPASAGED